MVALASHAFSDTDRLSTLAPRVGANNREIGLQYGASSSNRPSYAPKCTFKNERQDMTKTTRAAPPKATSQTNAKALVHARPAGKPTATAAPIVHRNPYQSVPAAHGGNKS
jgi:hypothetical protein